MLRANHKTGLVFFPAFDWAISPTHPEREERLLYTQDQVFEEGILDVEGIIELKPEMVFQKVLSKVSQQINFTTPAESGPYRLFMNVFDQGENIATANIPFYVIDL